MPCGTRREELLYDDETMRQIFLLRRMVTLISNDGSSSATENVLEKLSEKTTNKEFLDNLNNM